MAGADSCEWLYKGLLGEKIDKDSIKVQDKALYARFDGSIKIS